MKDKWKWSSVWWALFAGYLIGFYLWMPLIQVRKVHYWLPDLPVWRLIAMMVLVPLAVSLLVTRWAYWLGTRRQDFAPHGPRPIAWIFLGIMAAFSFLVSAGYAQTKLTDVELWSSTCSVHNAYLAKDSDVVWLNLSCADGRTVKIAPAASTLTAVFNDRKRPFECRTSVGMPHAPTCELR